MSENILAKYMGEEETKVSFEDQINAVLENIQENMKAADILSMEVEHLEKLESSGQEVSTEDLSEEVRTLLTNFNVNDSTDIISMEEEVGGMTDFLGRMAQVYIMGGIQAYEGLGNLFKSFKGESKDYREKLAKLKKELDEVSKEHKNFKASYVGLETYFITGANKTDLEFSKEPIKDVERYQDLCKAILFDHVQNVSSRLDEIGKTIERIDFEDSKSVKDGFDKLSSGKDPLDEIPKKVFGDYLTLKTLEIKDKEKSLLGKLGLTSGRELKWKTTPVNMLVVRAIPDVKMSDKDIYDLLDSGEGVLKLLEDFFKDTGKMEKEAKSLKKSFEKSFKSLKNAGDDVDKDAVKNFGKTAKQMMSNHLDPAIPIAKNSLHVMKGVRLLAGRLIAKPEK